MEALQEGKFYILKQYREGCVDTANLFVTGRREITDNPVAFLGRGVIFIFPIIVFSCVLWVGFAQHYSTEIIFAASWQDSTAQTYFNGC